jgi:hypothetical protein
MQTDRREQPSTLAFYEVQLKTYWLSCGSECHYAADICNIHIFMVHTEMYAFGWKS